METLLIFCVGVVVGYLYSSFWGTKTYEPTPREADSLGIFFSFKGDKMYILDSDGHKSYEYTLDPAWDYTNNPKFIKELIWQ